EESVLVGLVGDLTVQVVRRPLAEAAVLEKQVDPDHGRHQAGDEQRREAHELLEVRHEAVDDPDRDEEEESRGEENCRGLHFTVLSALSALGSVEYASPVCPASSSS